MVRIFNFPPRSRAWGASSTLTNYSTQTNAIKKGFVRDNSNKFDCNFVGRLSSNITIFGQWGLTKLQSYLLRYPSECFISASTMVWVDYLVSVEDAPSSPLGFVSRGNDKYPRLFLVLGCWSLVSFQFIYLTRANAIRQISITRWVTHINIVKQ